MTCTAVRLEAQGSRLRAWLGVRRDRQATAHCPLPRVAVTVLCLSACAGGPPEPASLDTENEACAHCRMAVSDRHFAAQIVAPGEEPLFFDDLGCLRDYLSASGTPVAEEAVIYVADHRTAEWVDARQAIFTRRADLATPMASGLMAHRNTSSQRQDPQTRGASAVAPGEILLGRAARGGR